MRRPGVDERPTLSLLRRIHEVCLRFEDCWQAGGRPVLEAFLAGVPEGDHGELLPELLLLEWSYRLEAGESFCPEEYRDRFSSPWSLVEQAWQRWKDRQANTGTTDVPAGQARGEAPGAAPEVAGVPGFARFELLGRGGMGEVWKAYEPALSRWVALKRVRLGEATPERLRRFSVEARALAQLQHPHIVPLFTCTQSDGKPVLVMEYIPGGTLEERLTTPLPPAEAALLVAVLAWALHAAHEKGITHRDLKPANILMAEPVPGNPGNVLDRFPKIADFGLASLAGDLAGQTLSGVVLGTPAYMSPEQAAGRMREVGPATDVWALGVILYRCLTGVLPFKGDSVLDTLDRVKTMQLRPVREERPEVPEDLADVCMACLRKDSGERPTAEQLAVRLDGLAGMMVPEGKDTSVWKPRRRRSAVWWAVGAGLVAASLLFLAKWQGGLGRGADRPGPEKAAVVEIPFEVRPIRIMQWDVLPGRTVPVGVIGKDVMEVPFAGRVSVDVELSEPGFAYLLALNPNGTEQLRWPVNAAGKPDETVEPPRQQSFRYPARKGEKGKAVMFRLDDEPAGGLQAFAVVASRNPLPSYEEWKKQHGKAAWRRMSGEGVWCADRTGTHAVLAGEVKPRGSEEVVEGVPQLEDVVRSLGRGEAVVVWAFPVGKKGD